MHLNRANLLVIGLGAAMVTIIKFGLRSRQRALRRAQAVDTLRHSGEFFFGPTGEQAVEPEQK